jgi:hypothetical protein
VLAKPTLRTLTFTKENFYAKKNLSIAIEVLLCNT